MTVHLHVRSAYTLLRGTLRIDKLMSAAKEMGYTSVALTDRNVLYGVPAFLNACKKNGLKPIIGMETDLIYHDEKIPFLLIARNKKGYAQLIRISSLINEGVDVDLLEAVSSLRRDCFIIAYGEGGWLDRELVSDNESELLAKIRIMKQEIGTFHMAVSYMDASMWKMKNTMLKGICRNNGIPTVALNKIYYLEKEDATACRILNGIRLQKNVNDSTLPLVSGRYFLTKDEMAHLYSEEDLIETDRIADACTGDYELEKSKLPVYSGKDPSISSAEYLKALCVAGLKKRRNNSVSREYVNRLLFELKVIIDMHFEDYFLIVYDFVLFAKRRGILVGPGRGSAAGSLVSYCLGITDIDPVANHLLFERFLNPERISMPDIDIDFPDNRRAEIIAYLYEKYGSERVCNIITFGTLSAKAVLRDVGRVLNFSIRDIESLTRLIPNTAKTTLQDAYKNNTRLQTLINSQEKFKDLYRVAMRLEGLPRHTSVHAAGIVLSGIDLETIIPTVRIDGGIRTSQYSKEYLEERGLIKIDLLSLRNLTIIDDIVASIRKDDPEFSLKNIDYEDAEVYRMFSDANTGGVFQFDSAGMKDLLRRMKPNCYEDLVAALALFRPGPKDNINLYLENRSHPENIVYPSEELKPILQETYGVMIYQEQIMRVAEAAAGFSLARADILRRAISKKNEKEIIDLKEDFIHGCIEHQYSEETATKLFALIEKFAGYGFNKSHAFAYGTVSYQTAWLKAKYPLYFYCALLDSLVGDQAKTSEYIDECRRRGVHVVPSGINIASAHYQMVDNAIILPISLIKGIGTQMADHIAKEREKNGEYEDFFDFVARASILRLNRSQIESLIDAGSLDCFGQGRRTLKYALDDALRYADLVQVRNGDEILIQQDLLPKPDLLRLKDEEEPKREAEKNVLGFTLGEHPIIAVRKDNNINDPSLASLKNMRGRYYGFAQITSVYQHRTKNGEMMAFVKLNDETADADMAVMPDLYAKVSSLLVRGTYIRFDVKISNEKSFLANSIRVVRKK